MKKKIMGKYLLQLDDFSDEHTEEIKHNFSCLKFEMKRRWIAKKAILFFMPYVTWISLRASLEPTEVEKSFWPPRSKIHLGAAASGMFLAMGSEALRIVSNLYIHVYDEKFESLRS